MEGIVIQVHEDSPRVAHTLVCMYAPVFADMESNVGATHSATTGGAYIGLYVCAGKWKSPLSVPSVGARHGLPLPDRRPYFPFPSTAPAAAAFAGADSTTVLASAGDLLASAPSWESTEGMSRPNACNCWSRLKTRAGPVPRDAPYTARRTVSVTLIDYHHLVDVPEWSCHGAENA